MAADRSRLRSVLPADGWNAVFISNGREQRAPIIGWGVRKRAPQVVGLIADDRVIPCDERAGFLRYEHADDPRRQLTTDLEDGA